MDSVPQSSSANCKPQVQQHPTSQMVDTDRLDEVCCTVKGTADDLLHYQPIHHLLICSVADCRTRSHPPLPTYDCHGQH
jgi:hypothetical protein